MATSFRISTKEDLQELVETMNVEKDRSSCNSITIYVADWCDSDEPTMDLLWEVLSNPYSKIWEIRLEEMRDVIRPALSAAHVAKQIKKWCQEIPATVSRGLELIFSEKAGSDVADLRDALTIPNNHVQRLSITGAASFDVLLPMVLQSPNNELSSLTLNLQWTLSAEAADALSTGLVSSTCKVRKFTLSSRNNDRNLPAHGYLRLLDGLQVAPCLEELHWLQLNETFSETYFEAVLKKLKGLIERPGNRLSTMSFGILKSWTQSQALILAEALISEHCRVEAFHCTTMISREEDALLPLAIALQDPHNRLKYVTMKFRGQRLAAALAKSLKHSNCKLESLCVHDQCDEHVALAIAEALRHATSSNLRTVSVGKQTTAVFHAFAESLRSPCNKLSTLNIYPVPDIRNEPVNVEFKRALRVSNIWKCAVESSPFYSAFNDPFFQVLHTLLSLKLVPRLGTKSWARLLPLQDFVLRIAETLGWPLDDLRLIRG